MSGLIQLKKDLSCKSKWLSLVNKKELYLNDFSFSMEVRDKNGLKHDLENRYLAKSNWKSKKNIKINVL